MLQPALNGVLSKGQQFGAGHAVAGRSRRKTRAASRTSGAGGRRRQKSNERPRPGARCAAPDWPCGRPLT